jgi:hypothetical protein
MICQNPAGYSPEPLPEFPTGSAVHAYYSTIEVWGRGPVPHPPRINTPVALPAQDSYQKPHLQLVDDHYRPLSTRPITRERLDGRATALLACDYAERAVELLEAQSEPCDLTEVITRAHGSSKRLKRLQRRYDLHRMRRRVCKIWSDE